MWKYWTLDIFDPVEENQSAWRKEKYRTDLATDIAVHLTFPTTFFFFLNAENSFCCNTVITPSIATRFSISLLKLQDFIFHYSGSEEVALSTKINTAGPLSSD